MFKQTTCKCDFNNYTVLVVDLGERRSDSLFFDMSLTSAVLSNHNLKTISQSEIIQIFSFGKAIISTGYT